MNIIERKKLFLKVYEKNVTNISRSCKAMSVDRTTYYGWRKADKVFDKACDDVELSILDFAESALKENISKGKEASIFFYLCNRAPTKWRNVQKIENEHSGALTYEINYIEPKPKG